MVYIPSRRQKEPLWCVRHPHRAVAVKQSAAMQALLFPANSVTSASHGTILATLQLEQCRPPKQVVFGRAQVDSKSLHKHPQNRTLAPSYRTGYPHLDEMQYRRHVLGLIQYAAPNSTTIPALLPRAILKDFPCPEGSS